METEFDCKTNDCDKKVAYKREVVRGSDGGRETRTLLKETVDKSSEVYLTCEKGHTHKYKIIS